MVLRDNHRGCVVLICQRRPYAHGWQRPSRMNGGEVTMATFGPYPARCVAIHDGDTATFDIDLGFGVRIPGQSWSGSTMLSCRVYGINAPELSTAAGKAALAYAETILHAGDLCTITSHGWDKYGGRFDGTITLPQAYTAGDYAGSDFASLMLASGNAVPMAG